MTNRFDWLFAQRSVDQKNPIDFVVAWVDGADPEWLAEKHKWTNGYDDSSIMSNNDSESRYRDWDNLRYWFRGVEQFAPWVRKVYFVTWGHLPKWLNTNHEKLVVVNHRDYIPEQYLPTFSSRPIELNLHRIQGLSEQFVFFNDDMFLIKETRAEDFFKHGRPKSVGVLSPARVTKGSWHYARQTDVAVLNAHFTARGAVKAHPLKWLNPVYGINVFRTVSMLPYPSFYGFMPTHIPQSYLRSVYEEVWEEEYDILDQACSNRIRSNTDVNEWLINYWQMAKGEFEPQTPRFGKAFHIGSKEETLLAAIDYISNQRGYTICVNDGEMDISGFEHAKELVNKSLESILPFPSSFEITYA